MRAVVKKHNKNEWSLTPMEGRFAGVTVMTVEGLTMDKVVFEDDCLTGHVTGCWGATIPDDLDLDRITLRGMGIGAVFTPKANAPLAMKGENFVDANTGQIVTKAQHVMLFGAGMFYNPKINRNSPTV